MQYFGHVPPLVGFISSVVRERKEGRKRGGGLNNNDLFTDCKKRRDPIFISLTQQEAVHQQKKENERPDILGGGKLTSLIRIYLLFLNFFFALKMN